MKILVTGANGYLGVGIVKQLLDDGNNVIATDFSIDRVDNRATKKACNLFEIDHPFEYFDKPDRVLHLAWRDGFVHNSDNHIMDLNKHYEFLSKIFRSDVQQIAVMGSMHEVGFYEGSIDEKTPCAPMSLYGIAKNALRNLVVFLSSKYNKTYQWLRGFYIVGTAVYGSSVFSKLVSAEMDGKSKFPFTMGLNQFDFLDYDEFCYKTASVIEQSEINGVINICSGRPERLADRVERFIKDNNFKIKLDYGAFPDRSYDSKAVWGNSEKIDSIIATRLKRV